MRTKQREEVTDFHEKALFRFPTRDGSHTNGAANEEQFAQAGSSVYEWWIRLTNETANQLYRNSLVGRLAGSMFETSLHIRSIGDAISSAILGNLWPALELPTAGQVLRLTHDMAALRRTGAGFQPKTKAFGSRRMATGAIAEEPTP